MVLGEVKISHDLLFSDMGDSNKVKKRNCITTLAMPPILLSLPSSFFYQGNRKRGWPDTINELPFKNFLRFLLLLYQNFPSAPFHFFRTRVYVYEKKISGGKNHRKNHCRFILPFLTQVLVHTVTNNAS